MNNNVGFGPGFNSPATGNAGLTLRDQIAIQAMVAFIQNPDCADMLAGDCEYYSISEQSYKMADAMLKERSK